VVCELRARVQSQAGEARATVRGEIDALARAMAEKILGRAV
jgi:F0F1-type ATP synthase membrane subunit b/b'